MSQSIEIPDHLAASLACEARKRGITPNDLAIRVLETECHSLSSPKTGAEVVAAWRSAGVIGSRPDIADSQYEARILRIHAENRDFQ